ncbi:MAG: HD domain-containing protein, partial [Acidobacteriota bacterium]|nr:HD domain-containing protein [Acidobacteriota bacterium]
ALRGVNDPESVTEHSWHLAFLVWLLAPEVPGVDAGKAVEMALLHDLAEVRLGDLPLTASRYFAPGAKRRAESQAFSDLAAPLGPRAHRLFTQYQESSTPEARLVKACDKLQLMLKVVAYQTWGTGDLSEFWHRPENFPQLDIALVDDLVSELKRRFASE